MPVPTEIKLLEDLPRSIEALRAESVKDGFRFVDKLKIEWQSAANRFDKPGEALIGAFQNERLVAVCGLNIDPYAGDDAVGRLRHLYVLKIARRQGIASAMVGHLLGIAQVSFTYVRLFTDTGQAAAFYEAIGFPQSHLQWHLISCKSNDRGRIYRRVLTRWNLPIDDNEREAIAKFTLYRTTFAKGVCACW